MYVRYNVIFLFKLETLLKLILTVPIVTSLSPHSVPSSGSIPGGKDRMLLIFGSNFHLWGSSPILRLEFVDSDSFLDIRPPDLIWWNENLLECQLPECANDLQVKVAN